MSAILSISGLVVRFPIRGPFRALIEGRETHIEAVREVSLEIIEGETYCLVGESGSGKTTIARAAMGLVPVHRGHIRFAGTDITGLGDKALKPFRRNMAMMFQDPVTSLSPRKTVRSLLQEPFRIHGVRDVDLEQEAREILDLVGLASDFLDRYPHQMSGGQARRVGVARALALKPQLIIADEPTAGLDVSVQGEILNLMNDLQQEFGLSYLIITHNLPVVRHISDHVGIIYLGQLVEEGRTADVFQTPAHPYTRALLASVPEPDPDARHSGPVLDGDVPSLENRPRGCGFAPRCPIARDRCRTEEPLSQDLGEGRATACHFPLGQD